MSWERDESVVGLNCLNYLWDPVTWLFPLVPLIPAALREVEEQQIEAIIICPGWKCCKECLSCFYEGPIELQCQKDLRCGQLVH